jgi:hypothetical protein
MEYCPVYSVNLNRCLCFVYIRLKEFSVGNLYFCTRILIIGADHYERYSCFYNALMSILVRLFSGGSADAKASALILYNHGFLTKSNNLIIMRKLS